MQKIKQVENCSFGYYKLKFKKIRNSGLKENQEKVENITIYQIKVLTIGE